MPVAIENEVDMARMVIILLLLFGATWVEAAEEAPTSGVGMTVFGNREAPKSMVIIPWRDAVSSEMSGIKIESVLSEELTPIEPEQFRRKIELHNVLQRSVPGSAAAN
ncbi:MAG: hypothetical protein OEW08_08040 [Gammaproteobacteria bacterium]|nr:hypothetical protein [Gammaproteobacteria bacterium]